MAYHILEPALTTSEMTDGGILTTALPSGELYVNSNEQGEFEVVPIITEFNASIVERDIALCNVVVHVIDNLLIPSFNADGDTLPHPGINKEDPLTPTVLEEDFAPEMDTTEETDVVEETKETAEEADIIQETEDVGVSLPPSDNAPIVVPAPLETTTVEGPAPVSIDAPEEMLTLLVGGRR
eukprot:TRINITY_DN157_c0_g2_i5.p3 TRINITY_DN157_c0_g2~~TRINITY_DN157_c0_g2_i5.p3  ORF type:complete len:182 (+),score=50.62 TRINITY_DN157_c0_g2_i5:1-546(+)